MNNLFLLLFLVSGIGLIVGLIKPNWVIRWGEEDKKNRKNVLKYFGLGLVASFILFGVTMPKETPETPNIAENTIQEKESEIQKEEPKKPKNEFGIDETWVVDGQWALKIDSVKVTDSRNPYSDKDPAQVVIVTYTYENLGYENDIQDLYLTVSHIIDGNDELGYNYSAKTTTSPQPTPPGAKCVGAEEALGLNNPSETVKVSFEAYDGNSNKQKATFICPVEQ